MRIAFVLLALAVTACSMPAPPKYGTLPETGAALRLVRAGGVRVGAINGPADFSSWCRGGPLIGQQITPPDWNFSFEGYVQNALAEELRAAGKYDDAAKVTLSGAVEKLYFSTTTHGMSGGVWDIALRVTSSNGKSVLVSEHYEFDTSSMGVLACSQAKDAYHPAVQNLIYKLVKSKNFKSLVASK